LLEIWERTVLQTRMEFNQNGRRVEVMKSTISVSQKRKTDNDDQSLIKQKRLQVANIEIGISEERRIWENDSEKMNFETNLEKP
jgi:hypothetical protein